MKAKRFPKNILETIRDEKILGIRAGMKPHRVITPGSLHFVNGFAVKKRRDTTTELVPQ